MEPIDYGLSFIQGKGAKNSVRFWIESRTRIIDESSGSSADYYQCGSCKSEDTFPDKDLFKSPNYDFLPIFGPEYGIVFCRDAFYDPPYSRSTKKAEELFEGQRYKLREATSARKLKTNEEIRKATNDFLPLIAQTEIRNEQTGLRAIIEYPVKTMNICDSDDVYQVDTGPVALPDLTKRYERMIDSISLAFVAFNAPHFADFVIEHPTPIIREGKEIYKPLHYSKLLSLEAKNALFCING